MKRRRLVYERGVFVCGGALPDNSQWRSLWYRIEMDSALKVRQNNLPHLQCGILLTQFQKLRIWLRSDRTFSAAFCSILHTNFLFDVILSLAKDSASFDLYL